MFVNKTKYKYGLIFTQILLVASLIIVAQSWTKNGDWVGKAVDLSGGTEITFKFAGDITAAAEEKIAADYQVNTRIFRSADGGHISISGNQELNATAIMSYFENNGIVIDGSPSVQSIGPALGSSFWKQAQLSILLGFIFMGISIYMIYKSLVPSMAIILSAASNMIETIAVMNILGIEMSLGGIAALLMMIGYSVDVNVVLTTRLLKKEFGMEDFDKNVKSSMLTGLTMSATSIAALLAIIFFSPASVLTQIATVLIIGLFFDIPNTWLQNSAILRWHLHA
ncbi:MAG: protein translocase subunit SecF [Candidatus Aenigmarchaeota archaeon]|nr:protein translocase subunit SecF [Candidatus Aenigmarchaeota archaeon]